jgi:hypothetical protein
MLQEDKQKKEMSQEHKNKIGEGIRLAYFRKKHNGSLKKKRKYVMSGLYKKKTHRIKDVDIKLSTILDSFYNMEGLSVRQYLIERKNVTENIKKVALIK